MRERGRGKKKYFPPLPNIFLLHNEAGVDLHGRIIQNAENSQHT